MRYSKQRELVMQTVQNLCDHPTAEEIYDAAVKECPGLSLGTVYRNLNSLVDAGRVRRVSIPGKADRFDHTPPVLHGMRQRDRCRGGRKAGNETGEKPEGLCAGLRCCADRRMRGLLREAGAGKRPLNHKICTEPLARSV